MRFRGAAIAAACVSLAFAPAAHAGRWTKARTLASPSAAFSPEVAVNGRGDAVLAWNTVDGPWVAFARRGGDFGEPRPLTGVRKPATDGLRVDIDDRGNAVVGWVYDDETFIEEPELREEGCCDRLAAAVKPAGRSSFGPARTVSRSGDHVVNWDLAAGRHGGGFLWTVGDYYERNELAAAFGSSGGKVGASRKLLDSGRRYFAGVSILIRRNGDASLAVSREDGVLLERLRTRSGRFGPTRTIARRRREDSITRRWAYGPDREFAIFSYRTPATWSTRAPGGVFRDSRALPATSDDAIDVARDGSVVAIGETGASPSVYASSLMPGASRFSAPRRLSRHSEYSLVSVRAAAANRGRGMAVWEVDPDEGTSRVFARRVVRGAPAGAVRRLRVAGGPDFSPTAASTPAGRTYVAWAATGRIAVARYIP